MLVIILNLIDLHLGKSI